MNYDVFISYSSKDYETVKKIVAKLESNNIDCWIAPRNIKAGEKFASAIVNGITKSCVVLLIFSERANTSEHIENEIDLAFGKSKIIIPFRIEDVPMKDELKYYVSKTQWIDGFPDFESKIDYLSKKISDVILGIKNTEGHYDIIRNDDGELLLFINPREFEPKNPRLVFDGGDMALLYRSKKSAVMLNNIASPASEALCIVEKICVVEVQNDEAVRQYYVPIKIVKSLDTLLCEAKSKEKNN